MAVAKPEEARIHPTAIVHRKAELGKGVEVGPYAIIGENVRIGDGTVIGPYVVIEGWTTIGRNNRIHAGAYLGGPPQDLRFKGERSFLVIGDNNIIREYVTIHRASGEDRETQVGSNCMLMAFVHIGHNCVIGDGVVMANWVGVSGHAVIEDEVVIGGMVGIHQFVRIGKMAMVGGMSKVVQDVPPFMLADGRPAKVYGLNIVGLTRHGVPPEVREALKKCYKLVYRSSLTLKEAIERIEAEVEPFEEVKYLLEFLKAMRGSPKGRQLETRR